MYINIDFNYIMFICIQDTVCDFEYSIKFTVL